MKTFYAYIRVSTAKQGQTGVSLQEQRAAIEAYARKNDLQISKWFEEQLTAAAKGRPGFLKMLKSLRRGDAAGVIIHKIDRSARNLRDWADLGDLIDSGIAIHFANESLDLLSRGGRLAADIQAVVASDFIRNLREETRKGLYGRLKQGLYPFRAPIGYLDKGRGQLKEIDPIRGPLIREAFELYDSGAHTIDSLVEAMKQRGLRSRTGDPVSRNGLSTILNNPFYIGVIRIRKNGQSFLGNHEPIISARLFEDVKARLTGRLKVKTFVHDFTLRGLFRCAHCKRCLIGERQKDHIYYRCHTKGCPTRGFREETLEAAMFNAWAPFAVADEWKQTLSLQLDDVLAADRDGDAKREAHVRSQLANVKDRLARLVDALVDNLIDKEAYESRRMALLKEERGLQETLRATSGEETDAAAYVIGTLELALSAQQSYGLANQAEKRELAQTLCSNRVASGKNVLVEPYFPFQCLAERAFIPNGDPSPSGTRTILEIAKDLIEWAKIELKKKQEAEDEGDLLAAAS